MGWHPAGRKEIDEVISFLKVREWACVSFTSRILNHELGSYRILVDRSETGAQRISGAVLLTNQGLVIPVLDSAGGGPRFRGELLSLISSYTHGVHSVMGVERQVGAIDTLLGGGATEKIEYHLMTREHFNIPEPLPARSDVTIRKATPSDVKALFPLQREYEKEEVLLNPARFNATASLLSLQRTLRREIVYLAEREGNPVAKAGTNARGINYFQIGGVYTVPELRGRGIGQKVMRALMWDIAQREKHLCLFVKKSNTAAIKLYSNVGFTIRESFAINYYRS
jgi:ribosomal protein S18 acetylase RimI-like enzyme